MLTDCALSSNWLPEGNTWKIKVVKKGTGHASSLSERPRIGVCYSRLSLEYSTAFYLLPSLLCDVLVYTGIIIPGYASTHSYAIAAAHREIIKLINTKRDKSESQG